MRTVFIHEAEEKFHSFQKHTHGYWEIILTVEGTGYAWVDGTDYPVSPGTILCIPPKTPHASRSEDGMRDFCVAFDDFVPIKKNELLLLMDDWNQSAYRLLEMLLETIRRAPSNAQQMSDALGNALYQLLTAYADEASGGMTTVARLKSLLMDHLSDPNFDLGQAMDDTGFSRGYLRRLFRESTGLAPLAWLNSQRAEFAKQYFRQYPGLYTVREVGAMVGILDPYYFSKLFKKHVGLSPARYVRQFTEEQLGSTPSPEDLANIQKIGIPG